MLISWLIIHTGNAPRHDSSKRSHRDLLPAMESYCGETPDNGKRIDPKQQEMEERHAKT